MRSLRVIGLGTILFWSGSSIPYNACAQSPECRTIDESAGYVIRTVRIEGRWVPSLRELDLSELVGKKYSPPLVAEAQSKVSEFLGSDENKAIESGVLGAYSFLLVRSCVLADEQARAVDVVIKPVYLRVDLYKVGANTLPVPRSLLPTFYGSVPKSLVAFNPAFAVDYDRRGGLAPSVGLSANLLDVPDLLQGNELSARDTRLDLKASGRKSIENSFYNSDVSLSLARRKPGTLVEELAAIGGFTGNGEPFGDGEHLRNAVRVGGSIRLRPPAGPVSGISVGANYRWSDDRLSPDGSGTRVADTESALDARVIADGRVAGGFARMAAWVDAASPSRAGGSYRRLAGVLGIEKEFGSTNQTFGVEAIVGAGRAWGTVPEYARFFGGNTARRFLYESTDSAVMTAFPAGPLIRSFGEGQAGASRSAGMGRGGTSYWHVNLNLTVPIPALSRPLVPAVRITDDDGSVTTLKDKLKGFAIGSAVGGIADTMIDQIIDELMKQGMSEDEATQKAAVIATARAKNIASREITPAVNFIADKANLYALKPLIMADAAQINAEGADNNQTRYALGGGIQLTVVVAKFEAGYLRTLRRRDGDPRGNFIVRLVFQNLF